MLEVRQVMDRIESSLDSGTYRVGDWQKCLNALKGLGQDLIRISNKLHRRNRFPEAPVWIGFVFESGLLVMSILAGALAVALMQISAL
jgi:hypothetical protein